MVPNQRFVAVDSSGQPTPPTDLPDTGDTVFLPPAEEVPDR